MTVQACPGHVSIIRTVQYKNGEERDLGERWANTSSSRCWVK